MADAVADNGANAKNGGDVGGNAFDDAAAVGDGASSPGPAGPAGGPLPAPPAPKPTPNDPAKMPWFTSFALLSAVLLYSTVDSLLDVEVIAASYTPTTPVDEANDPTYDNPSITPFKRFLIKARAAIMDWLFHVYFLCKVSARILFTMCLIVICVVLVGLLAKRLLVDTATGEKELQLSSVSKDPIVLLSTVCLASEECVWFLVAVVAVHATVMLASGVFMRPDNMRSLEKEVVPKLQMYMGVLLIATFLLVVTEGIRLARLG